MAIIPLIRQAITVAGIPLRALALPVHDQMLHGDLVVRPDFSPHLSLSRLARELAARVPPFDVLAFDSVLSDSAASAAIRANPPRLCFSELAGHSDALPLVRYEALLDNLSRNFRGNLRKARNKLEAHGSAVRVSWAWATGELADAFVTFLEVEASGWKGRDGSGTAVGLDPAVREFYRHLVERLGRSGACGIHLLRLGERPIAAQLAVLAGERCYLLKIGYDESYAQLAPGNLLLERLLKKYEGHATLKYVDLVTGVDWHASWRPERRDVFRHLLFQSSPRGLLAWAALQGKLPLQRARRRMRSGWREVVTTLRALPWGGWF